MPHSNNTINGNSELDFKVFRNVINGKLVATKTTRNGVNPSTEKLNEPVPIATKEDVASAVEAARTAFPSWAASGIENRRRALQAWAAAFLELKTEFATLLTLEQGKPTLFATREVGSAGARVQEMANMSLPEEVVENNEDRQVITRYTPLGVAVAIVPWNFPISLAAQKIVSALLTGNTLILKPSPYTPYCGLKMIEHMQKFFPPGVIQALSGNDDLGPWLCTHPGVDKISFTGSTAVGKKIMESASKSLKRVTLELGGNDPAIICGDVDIAEVAPKISQLAFSNSGQICIALKRVYVHESIYTQFRDAMVESTRKIKVGDGYEKDVMMGPIQNKMQYERVKGFFADIEKEKWSVACGGNVNTSSTGYFLEPTIIDNPDDSSRIVVEEPFGPIVPLLSWSTEDEVIARANNTKMGLGASVWTKDLSRGRKIAERLESGNVWVNAHMELSATAPFGGHKESGIGCELGLEGLKSFCNIQTMYLKKSASAKL